MDINEAFNIYCASISSRNLRPITQSTYATAMRTFIAQTETTDTDCITYDTVRNWLVLLRDKHLADTTIEKKRTIIKTWLQFLHDEGLVDLPELSKRIRPLKKDKREARYLTVDEVRRLLDAVELMSHNSEFCKLRDIALLYVICDTGLRRSELLRMTMDRLDLARRRINVDSTCKGRRERVVMFTPTTLRHLRGYLRKRKSESPFVWLTQKGVPISEIVSRTAIKRAGRAAGLGEVCPRMLRHSFCTKAINLDLPITSVQKLMGHANIKTTMGYVHDQEEKALSDYEQRFK